MYWSLSYLIGVDSMTRHGRQKINLCEGGISQKSRDICWRQPFFYMHLLFKDDIKTSNFYLEYHVELYSRRMLPRITPRIDSTCDST